MLCCIGNGESLKEANDCERTIKSEIIEHSDKEFVVWHESSTGPNPGPDSY